MLPTSCSSGFLTRSGDAPRRSGQVIRCGANHGHSTAGERYRGREGPLRLLVLGGSLGAAALNETVPKAIALMPPHSRPLVTHQAGAGHIEALRENYQRAGVRADAVAFIDDMATRYAQADLLICRAGASTIAELAAVGVAAVLVPFPHAVDDHQTHNARFLVDRGGAILIAQTDLTPERLADSLMQFDREKLLNMACASRAGASRTRRERSRKHA